jgi:hypothetical protein
VQFLILSLSAPTGCSSASSIGITRAYRDYCDTRQDDSAADDWVTAYRFIKPFSVTRTQRHHSGERSVFGASGRVPVEHGTGRIGLNYLISIGVFQPSSHANLGRVWQFSYDFVRHHDACLSFTSSVFCGSPDRGNRGRYCRFKGLASTRSPCI